MARSILDGPRSARDNALARVAYWLSIAVCVFWFLVVGLFALLTFSGWSLV